MEVFLEASEISISYSERCHMINSKVVKCQTFKHYFIFYFTHVRLFFFFTGKIKESGHWILGLM